MHTLHTLALRPARPLHRAAGRQDIQTTLDGAPVGNGAPGPTYQRLYKGCQQAKKDLSE